MTALRRAFVAVMPPPEVLDAVERVVAPVRPVAPPRLSWTPRGAVAPHAAVPRRGRRRRRAHRRVAMGTPRSEAGGPGTRRCRRVPVGLARFGGVDRARRGRARSSRCWPTPCSARPSRSVTNPIIATSPRTSRSPGRQRARPLANLVHSLGDGPVGPVFHVDEVLLMESDTRWDGAVYHEVASFPLAG